VEDLGIVEGCRVWVEAPSLVVAFAAAVEIVLGLA
jgi:hypothetical protein